MTSVAIIGAGVTGLTLAKALQQRADVTLFDKSWRVGGRMATRSSPPFAFDYGAQFFRAFSVDFRDFLEPLLASGVVQPWQCRFVEIDDDRVQHKRDWSEDDPHYVGVPDMNAVARTMAEGLSVELQVEIVAMHREDRWQLTDSRSRVWSGYDWVICTAPSLQSAALLPRTFKFHQEVSASPMQGCYSLMIGFYQPLSLAFGAALVKGRDISWISVNSSKPGRADPYTLLVHASNSWTQAHMEDDSESVRDHLLAEATRTTGHDMSKADHCQIHRWRYANCSKRVPHEPYVDRDQQLVACGDWCRQGRIEAAYLSAKQVVQVLGI